MRGKSELVKPDTHNQTKGGLERDYITQWSYGIGETFSLLVPNVKGGASVPLAANEKAMEKANPDVYKRQIIYRTVVFFETLFSIFSFYQIVVTDAIEHGYVHILGIHQFDMFL